MSWIGFVCFVFLDFLPSSSQIVLVIRAGVGAVQELTFLL